MFDNEYDNRELDSIYGLSVAPVLSRIEEKAPQCLLGRSEGHGADSSTCTDEQRSCTSSEVVASDGMLLGTGARAGGGASLPNIYDNLSDPSRLSPALRASLQAYERFDVATVNGN